MLYQSKPIDPSPSHYFLSLLEQKKLLLRVYTQNIDGLEEKAGVSSKKIVYAHGSLNTSSCLTCGHKVSADDVREIILNGEIPLCKRILNKHRKRKRNEGGDSINVDGCFVDDDEPTSPVKPRSSRSTSSSSPDVQNDGDKNLLRTCNGVMKPNITFFGEQLVDRVRKCLEADRKKADAVIVIGTSLSVAPMSKIIEYLSPSIPRILINRTIVVPKHGNYCEDGKKKDDIDYDEEDGIHEKDHRDNFIFDACLLGFCDEVTKSLIDLMNTTDGIMPKSHDRSTSQESNDFEVLANLPAFQSVLDHQKLFRHPHDRIFLYPGAILNTIDMNTDDDAESTEITFQEVVHCDGCHKVIKNVVMKCKDCFDFDLCQDCFETVSKVHFSGCHKFIAEESSIRIK